MDLEELIAKQEIAQLRLAFTSYLDATLSDKIADLFLEDAICDFGPFGIWEGRDTIRRNYKNRPWKPYDTVHVATNPWIALTGPDTARSRWYLLDFILNPRPGANIKAKGDSPLVLVGLYDDEYVKVSGTWKISRCKLQVLWPDRHVSEEDLSNYF